MGERERERKRNIKSKSLQRWVTCEQDEKWLVCIWNGKDGSYNFNRNKKKSVLSIFLHTISLDVQGTNNYIKIRFSKFDLVRLLLLYTPLCISNFRSFLFGSHLELVKKKKNFATKICGNYHILLQMPHTFCTQHKCVHIISQAIIIICESKENFACLPVHIHIWRSMYAIASKIQKWCETIWN